jgi:putative nucleotidyltransferase with HDIG domain
VRERRSRGFQRAAFALLTVTIAGAAISSRASDWRPLWLVLTLAVLGILGDRVHARTDRMRLSAGLTIVGLAMALLGPAPAVAICLLSRIIDAVTSDGIRLRGRRLALVWNLGMYVNVLAGALIIRAVLDAGMSHSNAAFALVVVGAISVANVINFLLAATWIREHSGMGIGTQLRDNFVPALPWITTPNVIAGVLVTLYIHSGPTSLLLSLALLGAFYVLLAELLSSQRRREELEQRTYELASLQVGVLVTMVRTLSLRDQFTARHSAAVARYATAIAQASGCSEEELRAVHTAGLLHDIGKFAFPDRILLADGRLSDEDYALVREHPGHGADLVRRVQGLEQIADVIRAHHERIDGRGYPDGLAGGEIPDLAKMISIGDVYDVMTARDTYRHPVTTEQAIAELRRVAGTQLDEQFVELFIGVLEEKQVAFAHAQNDDFEAELALEEQVRELARPRAMPALALG